MTPPNPITITRKHLYERVWTESVAHVASSWAWLVSTGGHTPLPKRAAIVFPEPWERLLRDHGGL